MPTGNEELNENSTNGTATSNQTTPAVMPLSSTTNVTTRKLAATLLGVYQKIDAKKADKVANATNGHLAALDGNGNLVDSQKTVDDFATSAQGDTADTAVQSVKMVSSDGSELNNSTSVIIPAAVATGASGATPGLMTSDDKKKLNEIQSGAEVNQNAFSNIKVGSTTIAADAKTDTLTISGNNHITVTGNAADDAITISTDLSSKSALSGSDEVSLVTRGEKYTWGAKQDALSFDGTYNATSNKAATVSTVTNAIDALDVSNITSNLSKSKTITALSETNGKISATASNIEIAESQVTGLVGDLALKAPLDSPALTGTPTAPTAETGDNSNTIATTEFVNNEISAKMAETDAMVYKGTLAGGNTGDYGALTPQADKGWTYKVSTAGKIDGVVVEVGDVLICNTDGTAAATSSNYNTIKNKWDFIQTNIDGAVTGPASSTDNAVAGFADASGKKIKQLTAAEIKAAAGLDLVVNQTITVTDTSVSDGTHTFNKYVHPTTTATNAAAVKVGKDNLGHVVIGSALTKADVDLGNVVNTGDSDKPVSGGTDKFTTGGAYTELNKKVDKETGKGLSTNDYTTEEKNKLSGIAAGAEVNQNAFSNIKVGSDTIIAADTKTDTVEMVGSNHVTITADTTNDKLTIATDLSSKTAASGGTAVSLVTTGEKYTWNSKASGSHTHGNITNGGALQTDDVAIANGDKIVITDASNSGKVARSSITFDASTTTTALTPKGTFEAFAKAADITTAINGLDSAVTSSDGTNVQVKVTEADGKITAVNITTDKTEDKNNKVTSWSTTTTNTHYPSEKLVKDSLDGKADKVSNATAGNFAALDANGNLTDSGKKASDFSDSHHGHGYIDENGMIQSTGSNAGQAAISNNCNIVYADNTGKIKKSTVAFDATSDYKALTQKGTFETMVKNVKLDGASSNLTNTNGTVTIPNAVATGASGATNGLMTAADKLKLDNLDNAHLGQGYGTCSTAEATAAKAVTLSSYELTTGGIVAVKFTNGLCANATLNINSKGAKKIFIKGAAVTATTCKNVLAGDIAYFIYDGTQYQFLGTDRTRASVDYDSTNKKITKTIDGVTTDVVTVSTIKSDLQLSKSDVGLGNVDNTADANKNVLSATKLTTARNIDGVAFDGQMDISRFGICSTDGDVNAKTVTISNPNDDTMTISNAVGTSIYVLFTYRNSGRSPTLSVNGLTALPIERYGDYAEFDNSYQSWKDNEIVHFVSTGTAWKTVGQNHTVPRDFGQDFSQSSYGMWRSNAYFAYLTSFGAVGDKLCEGAILSVRFNIDIPETNSLLLYWGDPTISYAPVYYQNQRTIPEGLIQAGDEVTFIARNYRELVYVSCDRTHVAISYDSTNKKITQTIDYVTSDVVTIADIKSDLAIKNAEYGNGYGTCETAAATTTKSVTLTNYELVENGIVAVKFTYSVPAGASLNINSKGAKPIYYSGAAISGDIIQGGDIGTFVLTGTGSSAKYILLSVDRSAGEMTDQEVQDLIDALI